MKPLSRFSTDTGIGAGTWVWVPAAHEVLEGIKLLECSYQVSKVADLRFGMVGTAA